MPRHVLSLTVAALCFAGCEHERPGFTEVRRIHEPITADEFAAVVRVVDQLPEQRVPAFPQVFLPPPLWENRSSTVRDLYEEELRRREECWDAARLGLVFERHAELIRELKKENLTPEQFAGLVLALGAALCRNEVPEEVDLERISHRSGPFLEELSKDYTPFSTLSREVQFTVLQKAMWLPRKIRAEKLRQPPPENLKLAKAHRDWLANALPNEFLSIPVDEIRDLLEERGMPFEELPESGSDEDISWQQAGQAGSPR